jgi:hypothetical protein
VTIRDRNESFRERLADAAALHIGKLEMPGPLLWRVCFVGEHTKCTDVDSAIDKSVLTSLPSGNYSSITATAGAIAGRSRPMRGRSWSTDHLSSLTGLATECLRGQVAQFFRDMAFSKPFAAV